ncbi:head maturation protease, ClpP-related [Paucisalibacillus globulus]|uniref:head maturation protease, ClpP-related n=1 Tax=Paucisalibacillus globulus TaxID=351095 RepID=UPI000BB751FA|nr:head maturation protease, ClpP-related [Paucisalibacillus globulus]
MKHKIKGDIISWNSSIWDFNYKMKSIKEDEDIELAINSYGGDMFLGIDIGNTLKEHKGFVTVVITGIAASAAGVIAMGANKIKMYSNTQFMLHEPWTIARGNSKQLRKVADDLEKHNHSALKSYTHRVDEDTVKKLMEKESYLTAEEALQYGFIDEIIDGEPEKVESQLFQNKAMEFNNKIISSPPAAASSIESLDADMIKSMFEEMEKKLINKLKPKEPEQEPVPKQSLSALFLNLK